MEGDGRSLRSLHDFHLQRVNENVIDIKFHAVIARHPAILGSGQGERTACSRGLSDNGSLVHFVILRKILANVLCDPHSLDAGTLSQALSLPARMDFRCIRRKCRRRLAEAVFSKTHRKLLRCGVRFHFGSLNNFRIFYQLKRNALEQIAFCVLHRRHIFDDSDTRREPAINCHSVRRCLLAMNSERLKFPRGHADVFFADHIIMLLHFQIAGLSVEVPGCAFFEWSGDHSLGGLNLISSPSRLIRAQQKIPWSSTLSRSVLVIMPARCISNLRRSLPSTFSVPSRRYKTS